MNEDGKTARGRRFHTTQWTVVCAAQQATEASRTAALEALCRAYWYPLYAYVRRRGYSAAEAEDLTQEFFCHLLAKNSLKSANQHRGKFRTFLLVSMKRFLITEWRHAHTQKRGGNYRFVPIDTGWAEASYHHEPVDHVTPDALYERRWALLIVERALTAVRRDMEQSGKSRLFNALKDALLGNPTEQSYAAVAGEFALSEGAVKSTVHRLRKRFRAHLIRIIADTVHSDEDIDEEIQHLIAVFSQ